MSEKKEPSPAMKRTHAVLLKHADVIMNLGLPKELVMAQLNAEYAGAALYAAACGNSDDARAFMSLMETGVNMALETLMASMAAGDESPDR